MKRLLVVMVALFTSASAFAQQPPSSGWVDTFDPKIAIQDSCVIEGAFSKNVATNRENGATLESEQMRFASYPVNNNSYDQQQAAADRADIIFVFKHPNLSPDQIQTAIFNVCLDRAKDPSYYASHRPPVPSYPGN